MSDVATSRSRASAARRSLPLLAIVLLALLAAALRGPADEGRPLDPRSTAPAGTKALVDSLRELGADVDISVDVPDEGMSRALILIDDLDDLETDALLAWVRRGGILVVADPRSELVPEVIGSTSVGGFGVARLTPQCDVPALDDVEGIVPDASAVLYEAPLAAVGCFPRGDGHWLVVETIGEGALVALGGQDVFLNARLGAPSTPALIAALLVPAEGSVGLLRTRRPGEGEAALIDLIGGNVSLFALQLLIAFLLVVAWRARRLGRPVEEPQPVAIPGSELVTAVGNLWHEADARTRAAAVLQADVRSTLQQRLGLPRGATVEQIASAAAERGDVDVHELTAVLSARVPEDPRALVALAHDLERLRHEALSPPTPTRRDP
jgi:hypothetical protein